MKADLQILINNAVKLFYSKEKERKLRLSRNVAIYAAKFLQFFCDWKRKADCRSCPFLKIPEGHCVLRVVKPNEWELPESEVQK